MSQKSSVMQLPQFVPKALMSDTFGVLETDFGATRTPLFNNYRSSPELVRIQHVLAQALDAGAVEPVSKTKRTIDGDSCAIWDFSSPEKEAVRLAIFVADQMKAHDLTPRDFALLVRQKAADYFDVLAPTFADRGLPLRNEAAFVGSVTVQDLLTEKCPTFSSVSSASRRVTGPASIGASANRCWLLFAA